MYNQKDLLEVLRYQAENQPNREVYRFIGEKQTESITFAELEQRVSGLAVELREHCVPGERILLLYSPGLDFISAFLGCLQSGMIAVPSYPPSKNSRSFSGILSIIKDCKPALCITNTSMYELLKHHFTNQQISSSLPLLCTDKKSKELVHDSQIYNQCPDNLAFLQYTSGSTSQPKGVMVTHSNLMCNLEQIRILFQYNTSTESVIWLPPYHDMGLIGGILQPLYAGFTVNLMAPMSFIQKPLNWLQAISEYRATSSGGPNFAYDLCVDKIPPEKRKQLDLSSWDIAFNGAEPISDKTLNRFFEAFAECGFRKQSFLPCYGLAEATLLVSGTKKDSYPEIRNIDSKLLQEQKAVESQDIKSSQPIVSCGGSFSTQDIQIVDPDLCHSLPEGRVGEIWISGSSVAKGYWNNLDQTKKIFKSRLIGNPHKELEWLRTGDLGFLMDGELFVVGRCKDLVIIRGRNYHPQDIEAIVEESHAALKPAGGAAFSVNIKGEERLVVIHEILRNHLRNLNQDEVIKSIRRSVAEHSELNIYAIVLLKPASLPKTTSGKVRRHACKVSFLKNTLKQVGRWELELKQNQSQSKQNRDKLELASDTSSKESIQIWLKEIIAEELNILPQKIELKSSFIDYGLDSLQLATISGELSELLKYRISPSMLQDYSDIESLSRYLALIYDTKQLFEELSPDERKAFLSTFQDNPLLTDRFNGSEIPEKFYCFEKFEYYQEFWKQNYDILSDKTQNPFFTLHEGLNNELTVIGSKSYVNYSCNNFLGLSGHSRVTQAAVQASQHYGTSVSASRLISGERPVHLELEREIADLLQVEDAIMFVGAATANVSVIGHLFGENDLILYDELSHSSMIQGIKLSHADSQPFAHNDTKDLERLLESMRRRYEKVLILIEGLYSMDGDIPDLRKFIKLKKNYKSLLMVDECLSVGVMGRNGGGIGEYYNVNRSDVDIWMGGISKAFASCGGYVAGKHTLIEYLKYTTPGFIFTTGISPANAAAALEAVRILKENPSLIELLRKRIDLFINLAQEKGLDTGNSIKESPIIPIIIGDRDHCLKLYQWLFNRGINVQPIVYPAVGANASRLRFSINATHTEEQIRFTLSTLAEKYKQLRSAAKEESLIS